MIFPWDQDKTWGYHDGIVPNKMFISMPLTAGMQGDLPPELQGPADQHRGRIGAPGAPWWHYGGEISREILANPATRDQFLRRVRELT